MKNSSLLLLLCAGVVLGGCVAPGSTGASGPGAGAPPQAESGGMSNKARGAAIGAAIGAIAGIATGDDGKERRNRGLIGAGVGALAGVAVGAYMDEQERKLRERLATTGVEVRRDGDNIVLEMPGNITFATDSADVRSEFYPVLNDLAKTMSEFDKTTIDVVGHTDDVGSETYNQALSERRAHSVAAYVAAQGVGAARLVAIGRGELQPVDSNTTDGGKARNRRVELTLTPVRQ